MRQRYGCTAHNSIKGGHERDGYGRCQLCGDGSGLAHNPPMPQTPAERQELRRKRLLMDGITEVRGIFLHESQHAALKEYAKKLAKQHKPEGRK